MLSLLECVLGVIDVHCQRHVLVDGHGHAVLTSFGSARVIGDPTYINIPLVGVAEYWAPELWPQIDIDINELFSKKSDIYAFGMLCFEVSHMNNGK